jgi:hypothetical protein
MPDEGTPAPEETQDKPTDAEAPVQDKADAPQAEPFSETFDPANLPDELIPAYKQLQGAATRKFQEAAALRQPDAVADYLRTLPEDAQAAVLREIGIELEADEVEEDLGYDDPDEELRSELEELKQWRQAQEQTAADSQLENWLNDEIGSQLDQLEEATGREFDEAEVNELGQYALDRALASGTAPDVKAIYESIYTNLLPAERKRWVASKKAPQAPTGASASHQPDLDDTETRREWLAQQLADSQD